MTLTQSQTTKTIITKFINEELKSLKGNYKVAFFSMTMLEETEQKDLLIIIHNQLTKRTFSIKAVYSSDDYEAIQLDVSSNDEDIKKFSKDLTDEIGYGWNVKHLFN